jgi:hypothetical protein
MSEDATVYIASYNTCSSTELAIRTCDALAGVDHQIVVGDGGSTDGTRRMLRRLRSRVHAQLSPQKRTHPEWLDGWRATCETKYCVFVDSDIEFLRAGWLADLVDAQLRTGAAIVAAEWVSREAIWSEPDGTQYPIAPRPSPWLLLLDTTQVGSLDVSFSFVLDTESEPSIGHDVAGAFWHAADRAGVTTEVMPESYRSAFRHYGGMTEREGGRRYESSARHLMRRSLVWSRLVRQRLRDRVGR